MLGVELSFDDSPVRTPGATHDRQRRPSSHLSSFSESVRRTWRRPSRAASASKRPGRSNGAGAVLWWRCGIDRADGWPGAPAGVHLGSRQPVEPLPVESGIRAVHGGDGALPDAERQPGAPKPRRREGGGIESGRDDGRRVYECDRSHEPRGPAGSRQHGAGPGRPPKMVANRPAGDAGGTRRRSVVRTYEQRRNHLWRIDRANFETSSPACGRAGRAARSCARGCSGP